jgi:hypothetical protein
MEERYLLPTHTALMESVSQCAPMINSLPSQNSSGKFSPEQL